jgi:hypothetical protein
VPELPGLLSPLGLLLWYGWNVAVLSSIQLTVRLIRAYSISTTLLAAAALTAGSVPITAVYALALGSKLNWFPVPMVLTGLLGFAVADRVLQLKRMRGRVVAAFGTAILSAPWPVFLQ